MGDLFATAEAIGDDQRVLVGVADGGQQDALTTCDGDVVVGFLEAESPGHATATRVEYRVVEPKLLEDSLLWRCTHDGFVMAVHVDDSFALELWKLIVPRFPFKELTEHKDLLLEAFGMFIMGEEIGELITEDGNAAWLKPDDGSACDDFRLQGFQDVTQ